ncbi:unnamed protein product [Bemisia tabaci]|uniref:Secreted protein n=1 Tax=Bemisia tabaci TaxID=7038 RepID=A0A9P0CCY4_BEMTA|nr:unnamed protein product [Bemisia tabaci]
MCPFNLVLVCILTSVYPSEALKSIRGIQINPSAPPAPNVDANTQALNAIMGHHDPCANTTAEQRRNPDSEANVACKHALNAFNGRPDDRRSYCRSAFEPKCRVVDEYPQCTIKKLRPRINFFCYIVARAHTIVPLYNCVLWSGTAA